MAAQRLFPMPDNPDCRTILRPLTESEQHWVQQQLRFSPPTTPQQKADIAELLQTNAARAPNDEPEQATYQACPDTDPYARDHGS